MDHTLELAEALAKEEKVVGLVKQVEDKLQEAQARVDNLVSELQTSHDLKAGEAEVTGVVSNHKAERKDARAALEQAGASALSKVEEASDLAQKTTDELQEAKA